MKEKLNANEVSLVGEWRMEDGKVVGDQSCERIEWLIENVLEEKSDRAGWEILYFDPNDGRYWELHYPQGHVHGGGPPALLCISKEKALKKYEIGCS